MKRTPKLDAKKIAKALGAEHRGKVAAKGGHFGAMQLVAEIQSRFQVPQGGGRPTDPHWTERRLVPLAPETLSRLNQITKHLHDEGIMIAPLQLAGLLLEHAARQVDENGSNAQPKARTKKPSGRASARELAAMRACLQATGEPVPPERIEAPASVRFAASPRSSM
jgi:hypothetical protein